MNSFISSFRPLLLAAALVGAIEVAVTAVLHPDFAQRANYLNFIFGRPEPFHKLLIYEKLERLPLAEANIVQVGDSSGLVGVRPEIVMRHLGGLRYVNLSCCANTGFDGYYDLARVALQRMRHPAAVVLYLTWNHLPARIMTAGDAMMGSTRIHDAFVAPWSTLESLPSQALRPVVTSILYTADGLVAPRSNPFAYASLFTDLDTSMPRDLGWWPEDDRRRTGRYRYPYSCRPADTKTFVLDPAKSPFYERSLLGDVEFLPAATFARFAALADRYKAKLIVIFQPHPCAHVSQAMLQELRATVSELSRRFGNVEAYPAELFEHWPKDMFIGWDHVRIGLEGLTSDRAGRFIAAALRIPDRAPDTLRPDERPPPAASLDASPVWATTTHSHWVLLGLKDASRDDEEDRTLVETGGLEPHYFETTIGNLTPGQPYIFSLRFKTIGSRAINLILRDLDGRHLGVITCDPGAEMVARRAQSYDADMIDLPDGWRLCWGSMVLGQDTAVLGINVLSPSKEARYAGDGESGIVVRNAELRRGLRLIAEQD